MPEKGRGDSRVDCEEETHESLRLDSRGGLQLILTTMQRGEEDGGRKKALALRVFGLK